MRVKNLRIKHKLALSFGLITIFILFLGITAWIGFGISRKNSQSSALLSDIENSIFFARLEIKNYIQSPSDSVFRISKNHIKDALTLISIFTEEKEKNKELGNTLTEAAIDFMKHSNQYKDYNKSKDNSLSVMKTASDKAIEIAFAKAREGIELNNRGFINFLSSKISEKEFINNPSESNLDNWRLFINNAIRINRESNMEEVADGLQEYANQFEEFAVLTFLQADIVKTLEKVADNSLHVTNTAQKNMQLLLDKRLRTSNIIVLSILMICIFVCFLIFRINLGFVRPLKSTTKVLEKLAKGNLKRIKKIDVNSNDEIGKMSNALNSLINRFEETTDFAINIGKNKLDTKLKTHGENDELGNSLIQMRESLIAAEKENKKRQEEEKNRNWVNNGLALFADILRQKNDNLHELSYNIINNLVKYLNANQGGVYLINSDDNEKEFLEQMACYAYDRRKYDEKRIEIGENLIGTCYLEKKSKYLKDIPNSYLNITSGLGEANPTNLFLVPLIVNDEIMGVIEIASFNEFEETHIEFIENVAEDIAGTISSVKINLRTAYLLEKSQQQTQEMRQKEEEMQQTIEELTATQEEMKRKEKEFKNRKSD